MMEASAIATPVPFRAFLEAAFELAKPRITTLLVIVALCSFVISGGFAPGGSAWIGLATTFGSVFILAVGIFTLNQWMERDSDRLMLRTRDRPLPSGRFPQGMALAIGLAFTAGGIVFSWLLVNPAQALVSFLTAVGYLVVYTPLKYRTVWHTALGALPGATPPLMGALAVSGRLDPMAWVLFGILFFWQFPHFLAIEMMYRDDYAKADIRVLPVVDKSGRRTGVQVVLATLALLAVAGLPFFLGHSGLAYLIVSGLLGLGFLALGFRAVVTRQKMAARHLLRASIIYLPLVFGLLMIGL
jgi:protoheme IX farnesyltransferase